MELARRDVLAALAAVGIGSVAVTGSLTNTKEDPLSEQDVDALIGVAEVVYPSTVEGIPEFVEQYSVGRVRDRPDYAEGIHAAINTLDEYAQTWFNSSFYELSSEKRDQLLDQMGVDAADPDPEGSDADRVRYYLVNELFYAFYTTPTGAELAGIENPQGYPGGAQSYQRGPEQ